MPQRSREASELERWCDEFEAACLSGRGQPAEQFLAGAPESLRERLLPELVALEAYYRAQRGLPVSRQEYAQRFPALREQLDTLLREALPLSRSGENSSTIVDRADSEWAAELVALGLISRERLSVVIESFGPQVRPETRDEFLKALLSKGALTEYQSRELAAGRGTALVLGNYRLLEKLGAGGMGTVFQAEHRRMKRVVALKVLSTELTKSAELVQRFQREVEAAARLTHPNIVQAFDADEVRGTHFLVMEFVAGRNLEAVVRERGPLPVSLALRCLLQAAQGLAYAHQRGVVHRDIKPANLLLDDEEQVKILDMGLARLTAGVEAGHELTATGVVMGTAEYMAPEQAESSRTAGVPADIYSLGCTLYFLLTGRQMYSGGNMMTQVIAHRERPIPALRQRRPEVPEEVEALFAQMVAKRPEDRFAAMSDLIPVLQRMLEQAARLGTDSDSFLTTPAQSARPTQVLSQASQTTQPALIAPAQTKPAGSPLSPRQRAWLAVILTATLLTGILALWTLRGP